MEGSPAKDHQGHPPLFSVFVSVDSDCRMKNAKAPRRIVTSGGEPYQDTDVDNAREHPDRSVNLN